MFATHLPSPPSPCSSTSSISEEGADSVVRANENLQGVEDYKEEGNLAERVGVPNGLSLVKENRGDDGGGDAGDAGNETTSNPITSNAGNPEHLDPKELLKSCHLLTMSCESNRVDCLKSILQPLARDAVFNLLNPSPDSPPYSYFRGMDSVVVEDDEDGDQELTTTPQPPPLVVACKSNSVEAASALLNFGADPRAAWPFAASNSALVKQSFGGEIVRVIGRDDAERFLLFLEAGMSFKDILGILKPRDDAAVGNSPGAGPSLDDFRFTEDFLKTMSAPRCWAILSQRFQAEDCVAANNDSAPPGPSCEQPPHVRGPLHHPLPPLTSLQEVHLLESTLQLTYNDMQNELSIIQSMIDSGPSSLIDNVKVLKSQMESCDTDFNAEMAKLESLLYRFDSYLDGDRVDQSCWARLVDFRYSIIERSGDLVHLDVTEAFVREKVDNLLRFQCSSSVGGGGEGGNNASEGLGGAGAGEGSNTNNIANNDDVNDDPKDLNQIISKLKEKSEENVACLRKEIESVAVEIASHDEDFERTGLVGALKHYRSLRDEARLMEERNEVIKIHQSRLERELELLGVGFYETAITDGVEDQEGVDRLGLPHPQVELPSEVFRSGISDTLSSHRKAGDSFWTMLLRFLLGYEIGDGDEEDAEGQGEIPVTHDSGAQVEVQGADVLIV